MNAAPSRDDYRHVIDLTVRWGDMDMLGHINNAKYFTYSESARIAYFESLVGADPKSGEGGGLILASIGCDFLAQLHYPAQLEVGTRVTKIGRSSMQIEHAVFSDGIAYAALHATVVWFDYAAQKTVAVPNAVRVFIRECEQGRVDEKSDG